MNARFQVVVFLIYGSVLCMTALYLAGLGHGSYLLVTLTGAPFSLLGVKAACLACSVQWGLLSIVRRTRKGPILIIGFLVAHYATAAFALHHLDPADTDLQQLKGILPGFTVYLYASLVLYLVGQIAFWIMALNGLRLNRIGP